MGMKYVLRGLLTLLLAAQMAFVGAAETITYYHNDALGSPVAATDEAGNLLWREAYRPYGSRLLKEDGGTNDTWFTGKQEDSGTGLSYFGARWYDPNIGRFMAIDPVGFKEDDIHSFNRYTYVANNPYRYVDPDGRAHVAPRFGGSTAAGGSFSGPGAITGGRGIYVGGGSFAKSPWTRTKSQLSGIAKDAKWVKSRQGVEGAGLRNHFQKHGEQVGAKTAREYDASARQTMQDGRRFTYRDRASGEPRVGYFDSQKGLFTATSQTRKNPAILSHFPEKWSNLRKLPGFATK